MRKFTFLLLLSCSFILFAQAQNKKTPDHLIQAQPDAATGVVEAPIEPEVYKFVEQMPVFDGDLPAFLSGNLKYPEEAKKNGTEGRVIVQFIIRKDGSVTDSEVIRSSGAKSLDDEALRVVGQMPKWKPGKQQGKAVNVSYVLPITFKLG